ncbi:unnamed protein product [Mytilus edulis]|uniref:Reverse transcriptase/retrotransposon-derived protein RNase H-like domain-containing protein n=1 Tax=Mytilus edulis TaxID=6550 RepID=A0A8S3SH72_MYTED|nr:unnamed protein product [Mytilus edulis]
MQIEVCGKHVTSLVDTGAQMSCCSVQLLQFLGISKDKIEISKIKSAMGVGGEVHSVLGLVSLPLILGNIAMRYNFHVFDKLHQQMILGFDFLHDVKAHIICDSETIFIPDSCSNTLNALELNSGLARTVSGTFIPPFHQANIPISVSSIKNQIALLEPLSSLPKMSLAGAKCCVSLDDSTLSCLRIMNTTKDKIFLPANYVVAAVTPVNSEDIISMSEDNDKVQNSDNSKSKVHTEKDQNILQFDLSNSDLTDEQKDLLTVFLHKNRKVFAENLRELGRTHMYEHAIETDDAPPVRKRFYRQTPHVFDEMNRQIEQMLKYDIIEESNSVWQSPVVMCKKKSGEMRFCVDYRKFIEGYSHITTTLNHLLKNDVPFEWSEKCQKAFDQLKKALCSAPILVYPNMSKPFILTTDASGTAIGYILGQLDSKGQEKVIAYGGRSLTQGERAWGVSELECLAVLKVDAENTDDSVIETDPEQTQIQETHTEVMPENIGPLQKVCFDFKHIYAYLENGTLPDETKLVKKNC